MELDNIEIVAWPGQPGDGRLDDAYYAGLSPYGRDWDAERDLVLLRNLRDLINSSDFPGSSPKLQSFLKKSYNALVTRHTNWMMG